MNFFVCDFLDILTLIMFSILTIFFSEFVIMSTVNKKYDYSPTLTSFLFYLPFPSIILDVIFWMGVATFREQWEKNVITAIENEVMKEKERKEQHFPVLKVIRSHEHVKKLIAEEQFNEIFMAYYI